MTAESERITLLEGFEHWKIPHFSVDGPLPVFIWAALTGLKGYKNKQKDNREGDVIRGPEGSWKGN